MLQVNHIRKSYNETPILHDVSFTAGPGDITILLGASGSGKSTMLRILNDLELADAGTITLNGETLDPSQPHSTQRIGMVFQSFHVFTNMSVKRNITFTLETACTYTPEEAEKRAHKLLTEYQLADKANQPASSLSGGQQQRLAIARTVATQPDVICFDEPTSALDPNLTTHVAQVITQLRNANYTVILATHDIHLLHQVSGMIHLLQDGKIVAHESTENIFTESPESSAIAAFMGIEKDA